MTLAEIVALPIAGNFFMDEHIFDKLDTIILDSAQPLADRLAALAHVDTVMGEEGIVDEAALQEYVEAAQAEGR